MAALIRGNPGQRRDTLIWDARLHSAAQKRARDMGERKYFNHVDPDGCGPNFYVLQTGYRLPIEWTAFKSANQVESILAGTANPDKAFDLWLNSGKHRQQVLGLNPFFELQTRFGIAHVNVPGSPHKDYWVYIGAPPEK